MAGLTGDMTDYNNVPATVSPLSSLMMLYMQLAHSVMPLKKKKKNLSTRNTPQVEQLMKTF